MPIIVGAPRSGTTLLRLMLDAHPALAIPPETGFLATADVLTGSGDELRRQFYDVVTAFPPDAPAWDDFGIAKEDFLAALRDIAPFSVAEGYRAFYRLYAARFGKRRWGDKTPVYSQYMRTIADLLPEAHFIHIIRDGRDVALSLRHMWFSPGEDMDVQARHWKGHVSTARAQGTDCRHYLEVRFEDLVRNSGAVLAAVCEFIDLPYDARMLTYHLTSKQRLAEHRDRRRVDGSLIVSHEDRLRQQALALSPPRSSRIGVWKRHMTADDRRRFEAAAGDLLQELGYLRDGDAESVGS